MGETASQATGMIQEVKVALWGEIWPGRSLIEICHGNGAQRSLHKGVLRERYPEECHSAQECLSCDGDRFDLFVDQGGMRMVGSAKTDKLSSTKCSGCTDAL